MAGETHGHTSAQAFECRFIEDDTASTPEPDQASQEPHGHAREVDQAVGFARLSEEVRARLKGGAARSEPPEHE